MLINSGAGKTSPFAIRGVLGCFPGASKASKPLDGFALARGMLPSRHREAAKTPSASSD